MLLDARRRLRQCYMLGSGGQKEIDTKLLCCVLNEEHNMASLIGAGPTTQQRIKPHTHTHMRARLLAVARVAGIARSRLTSILYHCLLKFLNIIENLSDGSDQICLKYASSQFLLTLLLSLVYMRACVLVSQSLFVSRFTPDATA